jgi:hypothetical protein
MQNPKLRRKEMKKKGLFAILGMVLAFSLLAAPVGAYDSTDHVAVAPNMEGDVLIYPVYFAADGLSTDFQVINTSDTYSTVVKIILRSHKFSQEVLDFLIFLSPNDVFNGTIQYKSGQYQMTTSDESFCTAGGNCASATNPKTYFLTTPASACVAAGDSAGYGYIVGIEAWAGVVPEDPDDPGTVAPADIQTRYNLVSDSLTTCTTKDIITGNAKIRFVGADISGYEADVLKNYRNLAALSTGNETRLGFTDSARNNLCEIEAALSKNALVVPYYNAASVLIATLPTKQATCPDSSGNYTAQGPFFDSPYNLEPEYTSIYYDTEEHSFSKGCEVSPCTPEHHFLTEEMNLFVLTSNYDAGWARFTILTGGTSDNPAVTECADYIAGPYNDIQFTGVPVVALVGHFMSDGFVLTRPAYSWGKVAYDNDHDDDFESATGDDYYFLDGEYQLTPGTWSSDVNGVPVAPGGGAYRDCTPPPVD